LGLGEEVVAMGGGVGEQRIAAESGVEAGGAGGGVGGGKSRVVASAAAMAWSRVMRERARVCGAWAGIGLQRRPEERDAAEEAASLEEAQDRNIAGG